MNVELNKINARVTQNPLKAARENDENSPFVSQLTTHKDAIEVFTKHRNLFDFLSKFLDVALQRRVIRLSVMISPDRQRDESADCFSVFNTFTMNRAAVESDVNVFLCFPSEFMLACDVIKQRLSDGLWCEVKASTASY